MEAKGLRSRSAAELADELVKLRKEQFALRMQRATGQQPKPDQFGKVRRNIAPLKTVLREKQAAGGNDKGVRKRPRRSRRARRRSRRQPRARRPRRRCLALSKRVARAPSPGARGAGRCAKTLPGGSA